MAEAIYLGHQRTGTGDLAAAIRFAQRAVSLTQATDPGVLRTLADAYGASGQFERAAATIESALAAIVAESDMPGLVADLQDRRRIYRALAQQLEGRTRRG